MASLTEILILRGVMPIESLDSMPGGWGEEEVSVRALIEQGNISMSSAAGVYQSLVGFCVVMLSNWIVRRVDKDQALF